MELLSPARRLCMKPPPLITWSPSCLSGGCCLVHGVPSEGVWARGRIEGCALVLAGDTCCSCSEQRLQWSGFVFLNPSLDVFSAAWPGSPRGQCVCTTLVPSSACKSVHSRSGFSATELVRTIWKCISEYFEGFWALFVGYYAKALCVKMASYEHRYVAYRPLD